MDTSFVTFTTVPMTILSNAVLIYPYSCSNQPVILRNSCTSAFFSYPFIDKTIFDSVKTNFCIKVNYSLNDGGLKFVLFTQIVDVSDDSLLFSLFVFESVTVLSCFHMIDVSLNCIDALVQFFWSIDFNILINCSYYGLLGINDVVVNVENSKLISFNGQTLTTL